MFQIDQKDIPSLPTRAALLILDMQNDIVACDGLLKVNQPPDFMDNMFNLVPIFRGFGQIMWALTQYTTNRAVNDGSADAEKVITDKELPADSRQERQRKRLSDLLAQARARNLGSDDEESADSEPDQNSGKDEEQKGKGSEEEPSETYLTWGADEEPKCCIPMTSGVNFYSSMMQGESPVFNSQTDWIFGKTHYSAFKSGSLIERLRSGMVHNLYICGALTNISIYATVLDAASHGYEITVISDCCGYKSEARHKEAIRRLVETTGCEVRTSLEIIEDIKAKERNEARQKNRQRLLQRPKPGTIPKGRASESSSSAGSKEGESVPLGAPFRPNPQTIKSHLWSPETTKLLPGQEGTKSLPNLVSPSTSRQEASTNKTRVKSKVSVRRRPSTASSNSKQKLEPPSATQSPLHKNISIGAGDNHEAADTPEAINYREAPDYSKTVDNRKAAGSPEAIDYRGATGDSKAAENREAIDSPEAADSRTAPHSRSTTNISTAADSLEANYGSEVVVSNTAHTDGPSTKSKKRWSEEIEVLTHDAPLLFSSPVTPACRLAESFSEVLPDLQGLTIDDAMPPYRIAQEFSEESLRQPITSAPFCEGDAFMIRHVFPGHDAERFFKSLRSEVQWLRMSHLGGPVPRLVAVQGFVSPAGTHPVYRHPADELPPLRPFSKTVREMIPQVQSLLGHEINHVLIQFYRQGTDHISEHSDKTLDIVPDSFIANVSLGAQREMTFRTKQQPTAESELGKIKARITHKETLFHNSMCKLGLKSNAAWQHAIRPDKRLDSAKTPGELAFNGTRISLTFRRIGTFLNRGETHIWGQGAVKKREASKVVAADQSIVSAFSKENHMGEQFDWEATYGGGFNCVHLENGTKRLFLNEDNKVSEWRFAVLQKELGLDNWVTSRISDSSLDPFRPVRLTADGQELYTDGLKDVPVFVDNDTQRTRVEGILPIFLYLDSVYAHGSLTSGSNLNSEMGKSNSNSEMGKSNSNSEMGKCYTRLCKVFAGSNIHLSDFEQYISEHGDQGYLAGHSISLADLAFWPLLHALKKAFKKPFQEAGLEDYYERLSHRPCFAWLVEGDEEATESKGKP